MASKYIGTVVNGFEVVSEYKKKTERKTYTYFKVKCVKCGFERDIVSQNLFRGVKCKCETKYHQHGQAGTRLYNIWSGIIDRTHNPKNAAYKNYGGRGISVCSEWAENFENFYQWSMKSGYTDDLTIDRLNNDGDYCPDNCRWITLQEQQNNRRSNRMETIGGETHTIAEWARIYGVNYHTVQTRLHRGGMSLKEALTK